MTLAFEKTFDSAAEEYDKIRPSYLPAIYEDAITISYLRPASPVGHLEQFVLTIWSKHQTVFKAARPFDFKRLAAFRGMQIFFKKVRNSVERPIGLAHCTSLVDVNELPSWM